MRCEICGEGETHLRCWIDEEPINAYEAMFAQATPILASIPLYGKECDVCGVAYTGMAESQVNRAIYVTLRREHGLPDSIFQRKWKKHENT